LLMKDIILTVILIICAWTDFKNRKIYNAIIGPGIVIALFFSIIQQGWSGLLISLEGFIVGIGLLFIPFILGGMGAGDVKLLGLVGAFNGPAFVFNAFIGTALVGGLMAVVILIIKHDLNKVVRNIWSSLLGVFFNRFRSATYQVHKKTSLPYGIAIALGTIGVYLMR